MLKSYKAIYTQGQLHWVAGAPLIPEGSHVVVMVETEEPPTPAPDDTRQTMQQAWGAWGSGKSLEDIDREIEAMRAEWERG